ncbi:MAG TPA: M23 family metallopeptidase [Burkholderiales bacterium]|nr:M23 family metallopeptidase [Burkholderiales bacterium]
MDIILVSGRLARAKTLTVSLPKLALAGVLALGLIVTATTAVNLVALRYAAELKVPFVNRLFSLAEPGQPQRELDVRENLNAMAMRLGQMQAQLLRLDTLGERLAKLAGFRPQDLMFGQTPGQGGAPSTIPSQDLSFGDLSRQLDALTRALDDRGDKMGVLDSLYTMDSARKKLIPTVLPLVMGGWNSSNYGWRIDPFNGQRAFHEGIDFIAPAGTPIRAAAGGVVVYSDFHPQYGNMVEIDHGNELVSRYAHASKRLVKVGDVVLSGALIAEVGRSGRSTGTHLHFEVRHRGVPQNPAHFLRAPG